MKANRLHPHVRLSLGGLLVLLAASCSERRATLPPVVTPTPAALPRPNPPPPAPPPVADWRDAPITQGTWRWAMEGSQSIARFGGQALVLSCNRDAAAVTLMRPGTAEAQAPVPVTILTSAMNRTVSAIAQPGPPPMIALTLPARDSLLDAMAFSRGRFVVETAGLPTLHVPSWPEVSRVIEDCR